MGLKWTQAQADSQLAADVVERAENPIADLVGYDLDDNQFSALVNFVFNIGSGSFAKSAVLQAINAGDLENAATHMAATHMKAWIHDRAGNVDNGLVRRRMAEIELYDTPSPEDEQPQPADWQDA